MSSIEQTTQFYKTVHKTNHLFLFLSRNLLSSLLKTITILRITSFFNRAQTYLFDHANVKFKKKDRVMEHCKDIKLIRIYL